MMKNKRNSKILEQTEYPVRKNRKRKNVFLVRLLLYTNFSLFDALKNNFI